MNLLHLITQKFQLTAVYEIILRAVFEFFQNHTHQIEQVTDFRIGSENFSQIVHLIIIFTHMLLPVFLLKWSL